MIESSYARAYIVYTQVKSPARSLHSGGKRQLARHFGWRVQNKLFLPFATRASRSVQDCLIDSRVLLDINCCRCRVESVISFLICRYEGLGSGLDFLQYAPMVLRNK